MHNIKLVVAYDGTNYLGWQKTNDGPTIEAALETVLEQLLQHPIHLQAASRTDRGVHAKGQVVNFLTSKTLLNLGEFRIGINSLLPKDIVVLQVELMPPSFHPTLDCIGKEYRYFISLGPVQFPHNRFYSWHVHYSVDFAKINEAIPLFVGKHNFAAFCNFKKNAHYTDFTREVQLLELVEIDEFQICYRIRGNHFLYKMVRNIVGTLTDIGRGKIAVHDLNRILEQERRPEAGVTAPAHGLFLHEIFYS